MIGKPQKVSPTQVGHAVCFVHTLPPALAHVRPSMGVCLMDEWTYLHRFTVLPDSTGWGGINPAETMKVQSNVCEAWHSSHEKMPRLGPSLPNSSAQILDTF